MHDILEESWVCKGIVQEHWLEGYEGFWKWSKHHSLWILENWRLDKTYRVPEECWPWQEMAQQAGFRQGLKESILAMQQTAINIVKRLFADLEELAKAKITAIDDLERLQHLIVDLGISHTREQIERVLLSISADA